MFPTNNPTQIQLLNNQTPNNQISPIQNKAFNNPAQTETGFGNLQQPQIPFQQAGFVNAGLPYSFPHFYGAPQAPVFQLHPQLLVYPQPNPAFAHMQQQVYAVPHLYVKFPENLELRRKIDEISMLVFKVIAKIFFVKENNNLH